MADSNGTARVAYAFSGYLAQVRWWPAAMAVCLYLVLTAVALVGAHTLPILESGIEPAGSLAQATAWPGVWARWDAGQYMAIAQDGYESDEKLTAWYPLYPLLIRFINRFTGLPGMAAGTLLSLLIAALSFVLVHDLVSREYGTKTGTITVILLALFPTAFYFFSVYSEGLFLLLSILAYGLARARRWTWAAGICLVAGLCRTNGFLVSVIVAAEYLIEHRYGKRYWFRSLLLLIPGVAGFLLYQLYLWATFGDLLHTFTVQSEWGRYVTWPWITLWDTLKVAVTGEGVAEYWFWHMVAWEELFFTAFFVFATVASWKLLRPSLALYLTLTLIVYMSAYGPPYAPALFGMPRYVLPLFPIYIVMAILLRRRAWLWAVLVFSIMLLIGFTLWFGSGHWVA